MTDGMNITATPSLHQMTACIREGRQGAVIVPGSAAVAGPFPREEAEALAGLLLEAGFPGCFSAPLMRNGTMKQDGRPRHIVSGTGSRRCLKV